MLENMTETKSKREYVFQGESSLEHYEGDFVVACVDDRFSKVREDFLNSLGIEHKDPKTPAGGAKVFSSPFKESDREHYLDELAISIRLHHSKKAILFTHHDCGAYGGFSNFSNDKDKEYEFHVSEHRKAAEAIKERFPDIEVETYFIDDKGIVKTS
jgi:hypothetical protein